MISSMPVISIEAEIPFTSKLKVLALVWEEEKFFQLLRVSDERVRPNSLGYIQRKCILDQLKIDWLRSGHDAEDFILID